MSFLAYLGGERPDRPTPERVYASIDLERSADRGSIVLEAVEADWFDQTSPTAPWLSPPDTLDLWWHVSLIEVRGSAMSRMPTLVSGEAEWFEVHLRTEDRSRGRPRPRS